MSYVCKGMLLGLIIVVCGCAANSSQSLLQNWPEGADPQEIGEKVVSGILPGLDKLQAHRSSYCEDSMWMFALKFAELTGDDELKGDLIRRFDYILKDPAFTNRRRHVDHSIFGIVPLELYIQTGQQKYLDMGQAIADRQWENPREDGLSAETRFWIDDMYMLTILQVQAYRATGDTVYLDRAALEMEAYLDKLQQPSGLFYHELEVPYYWGRGNGWVAGGMTEMLMDLPEDHPKYERIMAGYQKMMVALLSHQDEDGLWHQLVDYPESFQEGSGTAMFTYAMIMGVKRGWLTDPAYAEAARKGWLGLVSMIDENGLLDNVCVGTNKLDSLEHYLNRPKRKGDAHGQEALMWVIVALLDE